MARKINVKLILELRDANMSRGRIASTRHMSRHSVADVFNIADEKHITYSDVQCMSEEDVYRLFYPDKYVNETMYADPDYAYVHNELKKHGVTLSLLHEEYLEKCQREHTIPMGRTKFNEGYAQYTIENNLTNHLVHKPGEAVEVDWSGPTMSFIDLSTGEKVTVYLFVATLPYSQYSFVWPCLDMKMHSFIRCHIQMYRYFGGVPVRTVCDNLKTGVVSHPKEGDIILTDEYSVMGTYYMTAIMPTGVRKPKQKASVEGTVGKVATAVIARNRHQEFHSFEELKKKVAKDLEDLNHRPFEKREGSRYEVFQEEKEYLRPLPSIPYEIADWVYDRSVGLDFHVVYKKNHYSCPYQYSGKKVDLRVTDSKIEIFYKDQRIATHTRFPDFMKNKYSTHPEDMPETFRSITPWDDVRIRRWAKSIERNTEEVIDRIFRSVSIKEQGYNSCLSVLKLSKKYSDGRLENACEFALNRGIHTPRYRQLNAILSSNQDIIYKESKAEQEPSDESPMGYLRGSDYYRKGGDGHAE
jgi:transposase